VLVVEEAEYPDRTTDNGQVTGKLVTHNVNVVHLSKIQFII
jgi:hypothetical protein